jgi:hypothetical protein
VTTRHQWSRQAQQEIVEKLPQPAKRCTACGMKRTLSKGAGQVRFLRAGDKQWKTYAHGYVPDCVPVQVES